MAGESVCNVVEELAHAALVHDLTKDDEEHDVGGGDLHAGAVDTVNVGGEVGNDTVPGIAAVHEHAGEAAAEDAVDQEHDGEDRQGRTADAAGALQNQQDQDGTHDQVQSGGLEAGGNKHRVAHEHVNGHCYGEGDADPVVPGNLFAAGVLEGRIQGKAQQQNEAHMQCVVLDVDHLEQGDAGGIGQMVDGEEQAHEVVDLHQNFCVKIAGTGFFLVLFHDLGALCGVDRGCVNSGFVQFSHRKIPPFLE